jgi:hypothetical protein
MWNVIFHLYGGNIGYGPQSTGLDIVSQLFALEQQLSEWDRQLPESLSLCSINQHISQPDLSPSSFGRFKIILKLRFYNLRNLLHRPVLAKFLDFIGQPPDHSDAQETSMMMQFSSNSVQISVEASMNIIAIVRSIVTGHEDQRSHLGAWWFSLYYTFNAALVVFASFLILKDRSSNGTMPLLLAVSEMDLQQSLVDAALALRRLDRHNRMVDRCAAYLEQLVNVARALSKSNFPSAAHPQDSINVSMISVN